MHTVRIQDASGMESQHPEIAVWAALDERSSDVHGRIPSQSTPGPGPVRDLLSVRISTGAISSIEARIRQALVPAVAEVTAQIEQAPVKHTDGTSWQQAGSPRSLWTLATPKATSFTIVTHSSKEVLTPLFGERKGILISDRAKALTFWAMDRRQICWAHLIRLFVAFSEREGRTQAFGNRLLECARLVFDYWHGYKSGTLTRAELGSWMRPVIAVVEEVLARAVTADIERLSGSCADILQHKLALWTFVDHDGVEPTNNHAERELRAFVLWHKRSFGTQSDRGNEFAERMSSSRGTHAHHVHAPGPHQIRTRRFPPSGSSVERDSWRPPNLDAHPRHG